MTFEELDQRYPNGFVDAEITSLTLNYQNRTATLHLNLRGNLPDSPDRNVYERAVLIAREFYYVSIEPPDPDHLFYPKRSIQIDGYSEDVSKFPLFEHLKPTLPAGAFCCRFYVHDWNSFIHLAAQDGQFSWVEEACQTGPEPQTEKGDEGL
ncbi:MAG: hypothetical protein ACYDCD_08015 [Candidatus Acidiferrales bacterium]